MTLDIEGYENFHFEMLEKRYAKEREHMDSVAKDFPSLESVLKGESTLWERYQELHDKYSELKPKLKDSVNPKKFYANVREYISELTPFVRMMESLSGKSLYYEPEKMLGTFAHDLDLRLAKDVANLENNMGLGLIGGAFVMMLAPFVAVGMFTSTVATYAAAKKMKKRLYKNAMKHDTLSPDVVFTYLSMTTYLEDSKTRCVYAPDWFRNNREAFDDAYVLMRDTEQNYVEHTLLKQLGAGILPENDEIELARYFHMLKESDF